MAQFAPTNMIKVEHYEMLKIIFTYSIPQGFVNTNDLKHFY